jgi:hypothetical protein
MLHACTTRFITVVFYEKFLDLNKALYSLSFGFVSLSSPMPKLSRDGVSAAPSGLDEDAVSGYRLSGMRQMVKRQRHLGPMEAEHDWPCRLKLGNPWRQANHGWRCVTAAD